MHYEFIFKRGIQIVATITGHKIGPQVVTENLGAEIVALEQKLERMLGTRVHISLRYDKDDNRIKEEGE